MVRRSWVYCICRLKHSQHAMEPDIGSESRFLPTQPAFNAPVRGILVGILPWRLVQKNRMVWLPDGEKNEDMFIRFDSIHERHRQTDRRRCLLLMLAALFLPHSRCLLSIALQIAVESLDSTDRHPAERCHFQGQLMTNH